MLGWIYRVLIGSFKPEEKCIHEYKMLEWVQLHEEGRFHVGNCYISRCNKCGDIKHTVTKWDRG